MITKEQFEFLLRYKDYSSWMIWPEGNSLYNKDFFDYKKNDKLISQLSSDVMLVAFNPAEKTEDWSGFHIDFRNGKTRTTDYRLKEIAEKFPFLKGAYITDFFKTFFSSSLNDAEKFLKKNPEVEKQNLDLLLEEINLIKPKLILAIGKSALKYLKKYNISNESIQHFSSSNNGGWPKVYEELQKYELILNENSINGR